MVGVNRIGVLRYLLLVILVVLFAYKLWGKTDSITLAVSYIDYRLFLLMLAASVLAVVALSLSFFTACRHNKINIQFLHSSMLTAINALSNSLLPFKAGLLIRGIYMHQLYSVSVQRYSLITFLTQGYLLFTALLICLLLVPLVDIVILWPSFKLWVILLALLIPVFIVIALKKLLLGNLSALKEMVSVKLSLKLLLTSMLILFAWSLRLNFAFLVIPGSFDFTRVFFLQSALTLSLFFQFTPGNLGVREGVISFYALLLFGISIEQGVIVAVVDRLVSLITLLFLGLPSFALIKKQTPVN